LDAVGMRGFVAVLIFLLVQGVASAQQSAGKADSAAAHRRIAATLDALEKVLRAVHASHCRAPEDVEIRRDGRAWIVALEWEEPAKSVEWSLNIDSGRVVHGACVQARKREQVSGWLAFVRAARAAAGNAPHYQSAPERFQVAVARLPSASAWQVDFFTGENAPGNGEMVLVDDTTFRVVESKPPR
jgi:hypothetical protein